METLVACIHCQGIDRAELVPGEWLCAGCGAFAIDNLPCCFSCKAPTPVSEVRVYKGESVCESCY